MEEIICDCIRYGIRIICGTVVIIYFIKMLQAICIRRIERNERLELERLKKRTTS